jgi:hypothetical protein
MTQRNQDVLDMIEQVRARLVDLEDAVLAYEGDLPGFADKLDRVDDKVYLLETQIASLNPADADAGGAGTAGGADAHGASTAGADAHASGGKTAGNAEEDAGDDEDGEGMNILTPEAKAKIGETVGDMREIGREAAATFSELNEAFADITGPFKTLSGRGRR